MTDKDLESYYERKQSVKKWTDPREGEAEAAGDDRNAEFEHPNYAGDPGPRNAKTKRGD
jgi:hypothetical protein